jgi:hypothetical protein
MGEAKRRGTFEQRKAEAIKAGRIPAIRRKLQREVRANRRKMIAEHLAFIRKMHEEMMKKLKEQQLLGSKNR